jgi:hypothetical protein
LLREAQELSFTRQRTPEEEALDRLRGPKVADSVDDDPRFAKVAADPATGTEAANGQGSFESFMRMFGAPPPSPPPED